MKESKELATTPTVVEGKIAEAVDLTPAMQAVVTKIEKLFSDAQAHGIKACWNIGRLITEVQCEPNKYLTAHQRSSHVDGEAVLVSIFAPVYSVEQLRSAVAFFDKYPSESELNRLLTLRCPERPKWRLTTTHVQMLAQINDDEQRQAVEKVCAEEAYTARALAHELQELRSGPKTNSGRTHSAPKGLKQQVADLLQTQRRFIGRSEQLWLNEKSDNIYDDIANASPTKLDSTVRGYFNEIEENFSKLSDLIADHVAMCRKVREEIFDKLDESEEEEEETDAVEATGKPRSKITR